MPDPLTQQPAHTLNATQTVAAIRAESLTATQAATACLDRIALRDGAIRAWAHLDRATALASARSTDVAGTTGALAGLPVGVKDVITTRDFPTTYNCRFHEAARSDAHADASCVGILRQAGATIIGKTATVELASIGAVPPTMNPQAPGHTPGGSSSGSAAAVADGHVPVALGTQTGGSIIRPASFCGVWALKPTWGLIATEGAKPFSPSLDTIGWFARDAGDLGLVLDVFAPGQRDVPPLQDLRIALWQTPVWHAAEADTRTAMTQCATMLATAGAHVEQLVLPPLFEALAEDQLTIMFGEGSRSFLREAVLGPDLIAPAILDMVRNRRNITAQMLREAMDRTARCRAEFDRLTAPFDAVICPSTPGPAPFGLDATGSLIFNGMLTALNIPAVNMPLHRTPAGLPVGLTLCGPRWSDHKVLSMAQAIATHTKTQP